MHVTRVVAFEVLTSFFIFLVELRETCLVRHCPCGEDETGFAWRYDANNRRYFASSGVVIPLGFMAQRQGPTATRFLGRK